MKTLCWHGIELLRRGECAAAEVKQCGELFDMLMAHSEAQDAAVSVTMHAYQLLFRSQKMGTRAWQYIEASLG